MFSKYASLLALAATAIAGAIQPGVYRITSVASGSTARSFEAYSTPVFVSNSKEVVSPYDLWDVRDAEDGSYTLHNVGLREKGGAFYYYAGAEVRTGFAAAPFNIESAGNGEYVIKVPNADYLWNVEPPVKPRGDIRLRRANGEDTERWTFSPIHRDFESAVSAQDDYDERWELLQRIGRFLGQYRD